MDQDLFERVVRSLTNHAPTNGQINRIEELREAAKAYAYVIAHNCPNSRERSLGITHLEDSVMWAVKSIVLEDG